MGFFSWCCKGCGEEICPPEIARVVECNGNRPEDIQTVFGEYDGYGRIDSDLCGEIELTDMGHEPCLWHDKCYREASRAEQLDDTPSPSAPNQGMGWANPAFCSEKDGKRVQAGIDREKKLKAQYREGKIRLCLHCNEEMITPDKVVCRKCEKKGVDKEDIDWYNERWEGLQESLKENREKGWSKEGDEWEEHWCINI